MAFIFLQSIRKYTGLDRHKSLHLSGTRKKRAHS